MPENTEVGTSEKTSSIMVSENAKGQKSYSVKIYFDYSESAPIDINKAIEITYQDLHDRF